MTCIGLCHYKIGDTDGVSLEMAKWGWVLEEMGHTVHMCGGDLGTAADGCLVEELYHHRPDVERITRNAFHELRDYESGAALEGEILSLADRAEAELRKFIGDRSIDLLIPNNIWSIGMNLPAAIAFTRVVRELRIPAIGHHHDFYWEECRGMRPTCPEVERLVEEHLPPKDPLIRHVVINSLVQAELKRRNGVSAAVVPNVLDFSGPAWRVDSYNRDFKAAIGVGKTDILILQATRIVPRKGIELAIDLVAALNRPHHRRELEERGLYDGREFDKDSRIVLVLAGYSEDPRAEYLQRLQAKAAGLGVDLRVVSEIIRARRRIEDGKKRYALWDCYVFADLITYPSLYEGWGNQFLEAVHARVPVMIFEYPVYRTDIKGKGFAVISLGDRIEGRDELGLVRVKDEVIERAAQEAVSVLTDRTSRRGMVERNFALGKRFYSLDALQNYLSEIMESKERDER